MRLDMHCAPQGLTFEEDGEGTNACRPEQFGDVVLARKDAPASYHLAAVWDDALQGVTHVIECGPGASVGYATGP